MEWFITILAVVVIGLAAVAASGRLGQFGGHTAKANPPLRLPAEPLTAPDIAAVRFNVVAKGYAMDQVDELLARVQAQLETNSAQREQNLE